MPLDLTDAELAIAATACRAMAFQEGERAKKMENPTLRGPLDANSKRYAAPGREARSGARAPTRRLRIKVARAGLTAGNSRRGGCLTLPLGRPQGATSLPRTRSRRLRSSSAQLRIMRSAAAKLVTLLERCP